jgi:hypothetical protein
MFIGNDKISEVVNGVDSDGGNLVSLVNFLTTRVKLIYPSATAVVAARKRKLSSQKMPEAVREHTEDPSAGLLEFASDYSYPICIFSWNISR